MIIGEILNMDKIENKKKVGIITFHKAHNYGAFLQVYALQKQVVKLKNECFVINYYDKNIMKSYKLFKFSKNPVKCMKLLFKSLKNYKKNKKRYDKFNYCINEKLNLTKVYKNFTSLVNDYPKLDSYITGSDQVWNSTITKGLQDSYTLNFGDSQIKRISYAASVGDVSQISKNSEEFNEKISGIDYISVREEDAKEELAKIINKPIEVVLDPTLLLTKEEWNEKIEEIENIKEKYILAYVVEPDEEYIKIVNDLSERTGLKVIHFGIKNPGYKNVLKSAYTEGPLEFVNYIKNAEYVVATSFHATVFSIWYNKKFFIIPHKKTGSRVTNLLEKLEIENRTFSSLEEFKNIDYNFETDWEKVNKNLEIEREKSLKWLENAINSEKGKKNV